MNWIKNYIRPKIQGVFARRDVPDNLWRKCPICDKILYHRELEESFQVCNGCGHHMRLAARARLRLLLDPDSWQEIAIAATPEDPLRFRDEKRYRDRLKAARKKTELPHAVIAAKGTLNAMPVVVAVHDFAFMGGSLGSAEGEVIVAGAKAALAQTSPYICITAAGGARMQEGILSLMQMPRTAAALAELRTQRLPYIVILTHPTTGGVTASYGMIGDVHLAEPGALIGFTGPRVIAQTIRETLPDGFQSAEYLLDHGMVDKVVPRMKLRGELSCLLPLLMESRNAAHTSRLHKARSQGKAVRRLALAAKRRK